MGLSTTLTGCTSRGQGQGRQTVVKAGAVPSKEALPGWLGNEEIPSSWVPSPEAWEGRPKEATTVFL